uniref:Tigger transposable element-derived protein 1 n=1 Tax=Trichuris muris TaxID=70415 RepID=A0A5S6QBZ1_TRIMR
MRSAWSSILSRHRRQQLDSCVHVQTVVEEIAELGAKKLGFEDLDAANVQEMLASHTEELSNDDLLNLEQQNASEEAQDEELLDNNETDELPLKGLEEILSMVETLKEKVIDIDSNIHCSMQVTRAIDDAFFTYKHVYEEKTKAKSVQTSLFKFFRNKD